MHDDLPTIGSPVGPWLILERIDRGSFGVVFLARLADQPDSPPVALKLARRPGDPRFQREAEVLQWSHHPSIPQYKHSGLWTGHEGHRYPYVVMERVNGCTLYPWFRSAPRSSLEVLQVVAQLLGALASAHSRGVIHRDVKGENIRVTPEGRAVLLDWGSCWLPSAPPLTDTPAHPGTHAYRPPEQRGFMHTFRMDTEARWESRPSDDLYSLGVTLYRLVTGTYLPPCTDGDGLVEREVLEPSAMATVSPELEALILRLVSDDPKARGTAEQLVREALALVQAAGPGARKPIRPTPSALPTDNGLASSGSSRDEELPSDSDTEPASTGGERRPRWVLPSWAGAFVMVCLVITLLVLLAWPAPEEPRTPWIASPEEVAQFAPDAGVGEEALSAATDVPGAEVPAILSLARAMPSKPFEWQKKPPCANPDLQKIINGGCWVGPIGTKKPPCGADAFDYEDGCYMPVASPPRQPTSGTP